MSAPNDIIKLLTTILRNTKMTNPNRCDNCGNQDAPHPIQHDNGDGTEMYCNHCWRSQGYSLKKIKCPNLKPGEDMNWHACKLCNVEGIGMINVSGCCGTPEEWQDCEILDTKENLGLPHAECFKTVCPKCGNTLYRDCDPSKL